MAAHDYHAAGLRSLAVLETRTTVPRAPEDRSELFCALDLLRTLVDGYRPVGGKIKNGMETSQNEL